MYGSGARKRKYFSGVERKSIREDSSKEENKKLKDEISAMRHHLCLLEFGLGSIATLLLEEGNKKWNEMIPTATCTSSRAGAGEGSLEAKNEDDVGVGDEKSVGKTARGNDCDKASCGNYRKMVMGIGGVLADVETVLKMANKDDKDTTLASTSSSNQTQNGSTREETQNFGDQEITGRPHQKDRIYIDEKQPGQNVLTGVCNIKIVENAGLYQMHSFDLEREQGRRGGSGIGPTSSKGNGGTRSFVGLDTLASVASTVAIQEKSETNEASQNWIMGHVGHSLQQRTKRMPKQLRK